MYDNKEFDDMAKRDKDLTLYSQSNVIASYISMVKFAIEQIELIVDEIGDEVYFDGDTSPFPPDVLGDDSLFAGYTDPWSPDDDDDDMDEFGAFGCDCDACRCDDEYDDKRVNRPESKEEYFNWIDSKRMSVGNIMDILNKTRKDPKPKGYWVN
jgi:hypothetical protein